MAKIVTMGEIMLRLSTPGNEKFIQADEFDINYGGSEANVAVSLANYGYDTMEEQSTFPEAETVWAFIIWSRGLPCVRPTLYTTVQVPLLPAQQRISSILMPFSQMRTGSILPVSPRHFQTAQQRSRRQR